MALTVAHQHEGNYKLGTTCYGYRVPSTGYGSRVPPFNTGRHRFFSADRVVYALTGSKGDLGGRHVVKMACGVQSACCWPTSQTSKNTLALEAK